MLFSGELLLSSCSATNEPLLKPPCMVGGLRGTPAFAAGPATRGGCFVVKTGGCAGLWRVCTGEREYEGRRQIGEGDEGRGRPFLIVSGFLHVDRLNFTYLFFEGRASKCDKVFVNYMVIKIAARGFSQICFFNCFIFAHRNMFTGSFLPE